MKMAEMIASTYECLEKIGAGGGGTVYLANHVRLGKKVVLKADKREINTRPELLRREVDVLKNLSHPHIPQVYDFFVENDTVYTVMDYIEGESLDRPLKRGEKYPQAQVVKWARQLLDALCYLHNPVHGTPPRGFVHSDIKPANLMRTPNNDIVLIDFNIALALGEENVIGCSPGYASPEHYGLDFSAYDAPMTVSMQGKTKTFRPKRRSGQASTELLRGNQGRGGGGAEVFRGNEGAGGGAAEVLRAVGGAGSEATEVLRENYGQGSEATEVLGENYGSGSEATEVLGENYGPGSEATEVLRERGGAERGAAEAYTEAEGKSASAVNGTASISGTGSQSVSSRMKTIVPDIRSDIYSVGATLYHLLSGTRPARNAMEVVQLSEREFSPQIVAIIARAMNPNPEMRYQTAEEMLYDFSHLHENDPRMRKWKRSQRIAAVCFSALLLSNVFVSFVGLKRMQATQENLKLAEYSANALADGDTTEALKLALQAIPEEKGVLVPQAAAEAQLALTNALGVYNLSDGFQVLDSVTLPGAPFAVAASPEGTRFAAVYAYEVAVYDMTDQRKLISLPVQESALSDVVFVNEGLIVYAGDQGVTAYEVDGAKTLWTGEAATNLTLSADGSRVAAVNRDDDRVIVYSVNDGKVAAERSFDGLHMSVAVNDIFADPGDDIFALNQDGSMLAVSFYNGGLVVFDLEQPKEDLIVYDESDYSHFEGGFYGKYFAFTASKSGEALFGLIDVGEAVYVGGFESQDPFLLQADEKGILLANGNILVAFDPGTLEQTELAMTGDKKIVAFSVGEKYTAAATEDGRVSFFDSGAKLASEVQYEERSNFVVMTEGCSVLGNRSEPVLRLLRLENHEEAQLLAYDARYPHDEARVSGDGQHVMLFDYQNFRIYDREGNLLAQADIPDSGQVYDQQFRKEEEGSWLEVIWYDGTRRGYSAEDGTLIFEEKGEMPEKNLYEEFFIDEYRIASSLHTAPEVYDRKGRLAATLEADSYLTYVTQAGDYIVTEYISAEGERYGILLDDTFRKLAVLPGLCDVTGNTLVFDYASGDLRQCEIYSLAELVRLGREYLEGRSE